MLQDTYGEEDTVEMMPIREEQTAQMMEISLKAYLGIDSPTTTKLQGMLAGSKVVFLIDSRTTHNFVTPQFVTKN